MPTVGSTLMLDRLGPKRSDAEFISSKLEADCLVLSLQGELDLASSVSLQQTLLEAETSGVRRLVVDLSELTFMDSTGLQTLIMAHNRASAAGRQLVLRRGPRAVQRVFEVTGTLDVFTYLE